MDRLEQTICALATPPGEGGIAVIRVSGPDAYPIVEKIFVPVRANRRVADAKGYTAMLGHYILRGEEMDETVALFYRAPHSLHRGGRHRAVGPRRHRHGGRSVGSAGAGGGLPRPGRGNSPVAPWNTAS